MTTHLRIKICWRRLPKN